ncbi:MAG: hypothetical protein CM1200mP22_12530 [Dehalococcoidia bacterium]|nr:MAG: hypothetical protein CM1200mP22_12530 [Dehalococcoidia bacterium]
MSPWKQTSLGAFCNILSLSTGAHFLKSAARSPEPLGVGPFYHVGKTDTIVQQGGIFISGDVPLHQL